jgi:hypothetical protein
LLLTSKKERIKKEDVLKILDRFADRDLNSFFDVRKYISYLHFVYSYFYSVSTLIDVDRVQCQASVNPALMLMLHKGREFVDQLRNHPLLKEHSPRSFFFVFDKWHEICHIYMNNFSVIIKKWHRLHYTFTNKQPSKKTNKQTNRQID